jgi:hypothetical protein
MSEATTAIVFVKCINFYPCHVFDTLNDKLCDAVTSVHVIRASRIGIEQHHL